MLFNFQVRTSTLWHLHLFYIEFDVQYRNSLYKNHINFMVSFFLEHRISWLPCTSFFSIWIISSNQRITGSRHVKFGMEIYCERIYTLSKLLFVKLQITHIMMVQNSSQSIFNRFSIDRLYLSDEFFHHHHPHKNKNNDHKDDNNNNISKIWNMCKRKWGLFCVDVTVLCFRIGWLSRG